MSPAYTRLQIALHWIVAALIGFNFLIGDKMAEGYERALEAGTTGSPTPHTIIGMLTGLLIIVRMVIKKRRGGAPAPLPGTSPVMHMAANVGHLALYGIALLMVISGGLTWGAGIEAAAKPHEILTTILMVLVIGHVALALFHQFVKKDGSLSRMIRPQ